MGRTVDALRHTTLPSRHHPFRTRSRDGAASRHDLRARGEGQGGRRRTPVWRFLPQTLPNATIRPGPVAPSPATRSLSGVKENRDRGASGALAKKVEAYLKSKAAR